MFDNNYKNAMNKISVDNETYDKILNEITLKEQRKSRKNPAVGWRIAFACVACVAIVLGVVFVPQNNFSNKLSGGTTVVVDGPNALKVSKSYDEIYELVKPKKDTNFWDNFFWYVTDDAVIKEEIEYVDSETNGSNNGAAPGASNGINSDNAENVDDDFSTTTEQVEGVAEADIVKTDGKYIYYLLDDQLTIYKADGQNSAIVSRITINVKEYYNLGDMFLKDNRLIILQPNDYINEKNYVSIIIYDVSDPASPKYVAKTSQEGNYNSSRMVGDYMYLISNCHINVGKIDKDDPSTFAPTTQTNDTCQVVPADKIYHYEEEEYQNQYTVIGAFNYKDGIMSDTASLLGGTDHIYCSQGNIILADARYNRDHATNEEYVTTNTIVSKLAINNGQIEYNATGEIEGTLDNQFFIDEHNNHFRFVTTVTKAIETTYDFENSESSVVSYTQETSAKLTVLNDKLEKTGEIGDLAKGERVYSTRFMGDTAYFVTFRQTDPLFSADLSDPTNPKILGELKIPGFSQYMYPYGDGKLLGFGMDADENTGRATYLKLSMFNILDPSNVTEQDKTILNGYGYSTALENHKSMLVATGKNLIGFTAENNDEVVYMVYEYKESGFNLKASLPMNFESQKDRWKYYDDIRGMFIGDTFYLVSGIGLQVYDMADFSQIAIIK